MEASEINRLTQEYGASLVLYARQWCRHPDDAVQNALMDLMRVCPDPDDPVAWLFATVRRKAMNISRRERRLAKHQQRASEARETWFSADVDRRMVAAEIAESLELLPDLERQIVVTRIWGELSFDQIATIVSKSRSAVHRRYQQALAMLAQRLADQSEGKLRGNSDESNTGR